MLSGLTTGVYISVNEMKCLISTKLCKAEDRFLATSLLYKPPSFYNKCITGINMWSWWIFLHQNPWLHYKVKAVCNLLFHHGCLVKVGIDTVKLLVYVNSVKEQQQTV